MLNELGHYFLIGFIIGCVGTIAATAVWIIYNMIKTWGDK